jgi:hypothetical protein
MEEDEATTEFRVALLPSLFHLEAEIDLTTLLNRFTPFHFHPSSFDDLYLWNSLLEVDLEVCKCMKFSELIGGEQLTLRVSVVAITTISSTALSTMTKTSHSTASCSMPHCLVVSLFSLLSIAEFKALSHPLSNVGVHKENKQWHC